MIFGDFKARSLQLERIDRGEYSPAEFELWEKEMWFIHRLFGEVRALRKSLMAEIFATNEPQLSVLEVAAGSGRLLDHVKKHARGPKVSCVGLELSHESARSIRSHGLAAVRACATKLPFADDSFDLAFCTLFLHHLSESDAIDMLCEMRRVAKRKVFVIDLERRVVPYFLYQLFGSIFLQTFTREDGALSIKRAFRPNELLQLAHRSGLRNVEVVRSAINRLVLTAEG